MEGGVPAWLITGKNGVPQCSNARIQESDSLLIYTSAIDSGDIIPAVPHSSSPGHAIEEASADKVEDVASSHDRIPICLIVRVDNEANHLRETYVNAAEPPTLRSSMNRLGFSMAQCSRSMTSKLDTTFRRHWC